MLMLRYFYDTRAADAAGAPLLAAFHFADDIFAAFDAPRVRHHAFRWFFMLLYAAIFTLFADITPRHTPAADIAAPLRHAGTPLR